MRNAEVAWLEGPGCEVVVKMLAWAMVGSLIGVRGSACKRAPSYH